MSEKLPYYMNMNVIFYLYYKGSFGELHKTLRNYCFFCSLKLEHALVNDFHVKSH